MYNLLVSANENDWSGEPFVLARSRCVSEYTDWEIVARFRAMNAEQVRELCALPCVFAYEAECAKDPKFGVLRSVERRGPRNVRIEYSILPCEPFLTAGDLESMGSLLDIQGFEMNRTHWAVKDVDLARELDHRGIALPGWMIRSRGSVDLERHQFEVALSFPGEHRGYVDSVAEELRRVLGPDACFYDRFYEAQLARPNLDVLLQDIYGERSGLVVVFVCAEYDDKIWCGIEWRRIRERGALGADREIMYVRLDDGGVAGITHLDGYLDGSKRTPNEVAGMIVQRVRLIGGGLGDAAPATDRSQLDGSSPHTQPLRVRRNSNNMPAFLPQIRSGKELLEIVTDACELAPHYDDLSSGFEHDLVAGFLQDAQDLGELGLDSVSERMQAARYLDDGIEKLEHAGFCIFGYREQQKLEGGHGPNTDWPVAHVRVLRNSNSEIIRPNDLSAHDES